MSRMHLVCVPFRCVAYLFLCTSLIYLVFLSGVRDSVSHTPQTDDPSQTAEPPVLLDLPTNRSTIPWVNKQTSTKPTFSLFSVSWIFWIAEVVVHHLVGK